MKGWEGEAPAEPRYGDVLVTGEPWANAQRLMLQNRVRWRVDSASSVEPA